MIALALPRPEITISLYQKMILQLKNILGRARAKKGMFEGDLDEGELEIGQVAASIHAIKPAGEIVKEIWNEFVSEKQKLATLII